MDKRSSRRAGLTRPVLRLIAPALALALSGCGGGNGAGAGDTPPPAPERPVAIASCDYTGLDQPLSRQLSGSDPQNRPLTYSIVDSPAKGAVTLTDPLRGDFTYTPNTGARGTDSFTFRVNNGAAESAPASYRIVYTPRIVPLGDSITDGVMASGTPPAAQRVSYRKKLYDDLVAAGFRVDFVGSRSSGEAAGIADPDHEGNPGWCDDNRPNCNVSGGQTVDGNISGVLNDVRPDVVLLHIGTNHFDPDPSGINSILEKISTWALANHPIDVFLARIIPTLNGSLDVNTFNDNVEAIAADRQGARVFIVDQQAELGSADGPNLADPALMADNLHPNQTGYERMAARWRERLLAAGVLPRCP